MALDIKPIIYAEEYHEDKPSIFRESENLDRLLQAIFDVCYQQQLDFLWLSQNLLNVDVAEKSHLDFIGNIVGQPRFLSDFNTEPYFGFDGSYQSKPFSSVTNPDIGGFWNSRSHFNTATARQLNDDEYRRLIKARAIYNQSNCTANDLLEVINLLSNSKNNTVQMLSHGLIQINTDDSSGIISYFVDRLLNEDNILPIAAGVRVGLESSTPSVEPPIQEEVELYWDNVTNLLRLNGDLFDDKKGQNMVWETESAKGEFVDSRFGKSLKFRGVQDGRIITTFDSTDEDSLATASTYTVEFFAKMSPENTGNDVVVASGEAEYYGGRDLSWWVALNNSTARFIISTSGHGADTQAVDFALPKKDYSLEFSHFAFVYDKLGFLNFYVDGVLIGSSRFVSTFNKTKGTQLSVGGLRYRGYDYPFRGIIGQVRITKNVARYEGESFRAPRYFPVPTTLTQ